MEKHPPPLHRPPTLQDNGGRVLIFKRLLDKNLLFLFTGYKHLDQS